MTANILIVDDVMTNLAVLSGVVKNSGYVARPVQSAGEARKAIAAMMPDLILLDITMPDIDGFEFCRILKNDPKTSGIPIIFVSALNDQETKRKCFALGAADFIEKPFNTSEVTMRIDTQIKNITLKRELEKYNIRLHKMMKDQFQKISNDQRFLIYGLVKLAESREDPTGTHMINVSVNSKFLAQSLQLSPKYEKEISNNFIEDIELAAPLHDIGNLAIGDRILLKKGKLTPDEMMVMKTHTEIGARTLKEIHEKNEYSEYLGMATDIAYFHHEKWNGTGYPKNLKGEEIPISARIFSIVDVYDTLTREKCYRNAYSHADAVDIIEGEAGISFDPDIVDIFLKIQNQLRRN